MNVFQSKIDEDSQYERRDTLILSGPSVPESSPNENCGDIVRALLKDHTRLNLGPNDISIAHRVGRKPESGPDKRKIIFKLCRRHIVSDIVNACKQYTPPLYVNPSLTPIRSKILYALRQLRNKFPGKIERCRASPFNGDICAYLKLNNSSARGPIKLIIINSCEKLEAFAADHLQTSIGFYNLIGKYI